MCVVGVHATYPVMVWSLVAAVNSGQPQQDSFDNGKTTSRYDRAGRSGVSPKCKITTQLLGSDAHLQLEHISAVFAGIASMLEIRWCVVDLPWGVGFLSCCTRKRDIDLQFD